jgi:iron complex outermembrane recepter protein
MISLRCAHNKIRRGLERVRTNFCLPFGCVTLLMTSQVTLAGNLEHQTYFHIVAQPLNKALLEFGSQAHVQIMFASNQAMVRSRTTAVLGYYTGKQALTALLAGSALGFVEHGNTIQIVPRGPPVSEARDPANRQLDPTSKEVTATHGSRAPQTVQSQTQENSGRRRRQELKQIVIAGSRIPLTSQYGPQEIQVYDREQIEQSGQASVSDFLNTLPSVSVTSPPVENGYATTVQLRGLPEGTTLVLLDGRPLESSGMGGGVFFDLTDIPLAAVERFEVDETGSSAVYGSNAIAGVVNIVLRKDFSGFAVDTRYGSAKDYRQLRTDVAMGRQWDRGGFSVIASYDVDGGLSSSSRLLSASNDYTNFGGPDNNYPMCFPGNVFSTSGAPLPGAPANSGATYAAVSGLAASGKSSLSEFTYGALNECAALAGQSIIPHMSRAGILVQGHLEITSAVELFTELMYTHVSLSAAIQDGWLLGFPGYQQFTVSASNPYNPFGTTVGVAESLPDVPVYQDFDTDFSQSVVGARGSLLGRWPWEISAWQSVDWTDRTLVNYSENNNAVQEALDSSDPATALNPFVNGAIGPPTVVQTLFSNAYQKLMGRDRAAQAFIRGPLTHLPAGSVQAVIGTQYDQARFYNNSTNLVSSGQSIFGRDRDSYAAFGEARIPVIGFHDALGMRNVLSLTLAGRHDQYSDFGGATTEQYGFELRPTRSLLLRGSYAKGFEAPSLTQLYNPQQQVETVVTDPTSGNSVPVQELSGGNPQLHPLTGLSRSFGVVYSSRALTGLSLSATQWHVVEANAIQAVLPQVIVDNANYFPGRVVRNSAGAIVEIDDTFVNFGSIDVAGMDYQSEYRRRLGDGDLSLDADVTEIFHYRQAFAPGAAPIEATGVAEDDGNWSPRWKGLLGITWSEEALSAHVDGHYTSSYQDYDSTERIGNFWIVDADLRWRFGEWFVSNNRWIKDDYVEAGATNLLNRAPQFSNYASDFLGYDAAQMSILGRSIYLDVGARWQ